MPTLSSFITYLPKRKPKIQVISQIESPPNLYPATVAATATSKSKSTHHNHPYAPPVIDINDLGRLEEVAGPSGSANDINEEPQGQEHGPYYNTANTPRVTVNVPLDPEPLTDWFPSSLLSRSSEALTLDARPNLNEAIGTGSGYYAGKGRAIPEIMEQTKSVEDRKDDADNALAGMKGSYFVGDVQFDLPQPSFRKTVPTPIKIPKPLSAAVANSGKVQLISSPDTIASAVSGATFARALMANTFVLSGSGSGRDSRYRSGGSTLTRTDSATLPKSEFASVSNVNTNSWSSGGSVQFSPGSGIPPVPGNAEKVYVPPQTQRASVERSMQRSPKESESEHKLHTPLTHSDTPSLASTIALALSERLPISHTPLDTPSPSSAPASSPLSSAPSSARDLDHVLDYYSFADTPTPTPPDSDEQHVFRPPFSPIIEESASQLSPPTPYERERDAAALGARSPESVQSTISPSSLSSATGGKRNVPPGSGKFFLGSSTSASAGGARVGWTIRPASSSSSPRRDSSAPLSLSVPTPLAKPLLPIGTGRSRSPSASPVASATLPHRPLSKSPTPSTSTTNSTLTSTSASTPHPLSHSHGHGHPTRPSVSSIPESVTNSIISFSITSTPPSLSPPLAFPGSSNPSTSNSMPSRKQNPTHTMTPPRRPRPQNRSGSAPVPSPIKVVRNVGGPMYDSGSSGGGTPGNEGVDGRGGERVGEDEKSQEGDENGVEDEDHETDKDRDEAEDNNKRDLELEQEREREQKDQTHDITRTGTLRSQQTFPETPTAFSPTSTASPFTSVSPTPFTTFSPSPYTVPTSVAVSPAAGIGIGEYPMVMPYTPESASVASAFATQQQQQDQILSTRAATSIQTQRAQRPGSRGVNSKQGGRVEAGSEQGRESGVDLGLHKREQEDVFFIR